MFVVGEVDCEGLIRVRWNLRLDQVFELFNAGVLVQLGKVELLAQALDEQVLRQLFPRLHYRSLQNKVFW